MEPLQPDITGHLDAIGASGKPARLGILGGTFDPIHLGHLRIAEEMRQALSLDGVLFIPAGVPVFKKDQQVTPASARLAQVIRATANNPHFGVCDWEVRREGDTYTVDTLRVLRQVYPAEVQLYFIVGADAAPTLPQWYKADELAHLATFAIAGGRPGAPDQQQVEHALTGVPSFSFEYVAVSALDISSSEVRMLAQEGKSIRYLVPECIRGELMRQWQPRLLGEDVQRSHDEGNPYSDAFLEARRHELRQRVSERRFEHCEGVSDAAVMLARRYGVDEDAARLAGLLHDWDKGYDDEGIRARVAELGMEDELDPTIVANLPGTLHGFTAARALSREFPHIPHEVIQAIERHTVGAEDMEPLDMVLYIADAIEPSRQFGRIDELRALVGEVSLEELFFETYRYWTSLLLERNRPLYPDTIRIWNSYAARLHPKKRKQGK